MSADCWRDPNRRRVMKCLPAPDSCAEDITREALVDAESMSRRVVDLFCAAAGYKIVASYFTIALLPMSFLLHSAAVLAILLAIELLAISLATRMVAASARLAAQRALRLALSGGVLAFEEERRLLETTQEHIEKIRALRKAIEE